MTGNLSIGLIVISILLFSLASPAKIAAQPLIKVNNRVITVDEFKRMSQMDVFQAQLSKKDRQELVDNVIFFELAVQEAKKQGFTQLDSVQDEMNIALFKAYFNSQIHPKVQQINVSDKLIDAEYKSMPIVDSSHIFIPVSVAATPAAKAQAKAIIDSIYNTIMSKGAGDREKTFVEMAKKHSADPSSTNGGRLGFLGGDQALPHYYNVIRSLKVGQVSETFVSTYGWHLAMSHKQLPSKDMGPVYRGFLETKIRTAAGVKVMKEEADKLRKNAKVSVDTALLNK